jgi:hypothetical protein
VTYNAFTLLISSRSGMMDFVFEGRASDSPLVESVWRTQSNHSGSFISSAATQMGIVVTKYQGNTTFTIRGPETKASLADCPADAEFFGIIFKLGTFMPHLPTKSVSDRNDLNLPFATANAIWLNHHVWQLPTYENADTFVAQLVRQGVLAYEPVVDAMIQGEIPDYAVRTLQYRFLRATGLTHSTLRQIERARHAVRLLEQGTSILDTTYEAGYFDQAHLTRSLKRYFGQTPSQMARVKS